MCGGGGGSPAPAPTVDPEAERRAAEAEAAKKANEQAVLDARRRRQQKGFLATDSEGGETVLSKASGAKPATGGSVLSSGG